MVGLTRWTPFEDLFNFQRDADRLFSQFWNDLPSRAPTNASPSFQVTTTDEGDWRIDVPLPGIDPKYVSLDVTGNTLSIRADVPGEHTDKNPTHYEQTLTIPQFLNIDKMTASHHHGMLRLTLPLKESVKPRRIQIETRAEDQKQLAGAK